MDDQIYCPHCGYNLQGLERERCPECGEAFDLKELRISQIPWTHRARIGRFRSYWRTVWMVTFRNSRFVNEINNTVSYRDAQLFRWITIALMSFTIQMAMGALYIALASGLLAKSSLFVQACRALWPVPVAFLLIVLFLAAITGVQSYWFHPRSLPVVRQNRAVALSYYACAALSWTPVITLIFAACVTWYVVAQNISGELALTLGVILFVLQMLIWWRLQVRTLMRVTDHSVAGIVVFALALPLCWVVLGTVIVVGIPATLVYVVAFILTRGQG